VAELIGDQLRIDTGLTGKTGMRASHDLKRAVLVRTSSSPIRYERRLPDGSLEVFAQPDGVSTFPRRVFVTQWIDPNGNGVTLPTIPVCD
jgi:hypothetical protein